MTTTFSPAEALAICEQATPGPWRVSMSGYSVKSHDVDIPIVAAVHHGAQATARDVERWLPNADFIAYARTALPAAARRVLELEALLNTRAVATVGVLDVARGEHERLAAERDAANTECEQLRIARAAAGQRVLELEEREPTVEEMAWLLGDRQEIPQGDPYPAGWPTIRRCRHCLTPVAGGPTACVRCVARIEGEDAGRRAVTADAALMLGLDEERIEALTAERDAALREADRLRHGVAVEGDHVCPAELERDQLRSECERLRAEATRIEGERHAAVETNIADELKFDEAIARMSGVVGTLDAQVATLRAECERLTKERDEAVTELDVLLEAVMLGPLKGKTAHDEIVSLRAECERLTKERDAYRAGLADLLAAVSHTATSTQDIINARELLKNGPTKREAGIE